MEATTGPQPTTGTAARKNEQSKRTVQTRLYIFSWNKQLQSSAMQAACELLIQMGGSH